MKSTLFKVCFFYLQFCVIFVTSSRARKSLEGCAFINISFKNKLIMANFDLSTWVGAQAKVSNFYKNAENRTIDPVLTRMIMRNGEIMTPGYSELKKSEQRPITTNFMIKQPRALGTGGRVHNHSGVQAETQNQTFTWTTYDDKFASTLKQNNNNIYSFDETEMHKVRNVLHNFGEDLENKSSDFLLANRTGVNIADVKGTFNTTNSVYEINGATYGSNAIQITKMVMKLNKYSGFRYVVVCDSWAYTDFENDAAQGAQNATNLSFQYQGVTFMHDIHLTASAAAISGAYSFGVWHVVPEGSVSGLPWIPEQNRTGVDTKVNTYANLADPMTGLNLAVHSYEQTGDGTSLGGQTQDVLMQHEFSIDIAYNTAKLSTTNETGIFTFAKV